MKFESCSGKVLLPPALNADTILRAEQNNTQNVLTSADVTLAVVVELNARGMADVASSF